MTLCVRMYCMRINTQKYTHTTCIDDALAVGSGSEGSTPDILFHIHTIRVHAYARAHVRTHKAVGL